MTGCSEQPAVESAILASTVPENSTGASADDPPAQDASGEPGTGPTTTVAGSAERPVIQTAQRPDWLGTRVLPTGPDGRVITPQTTPEELVDRRFATVDVFDSPGDRFTSSIGPVPAEVLARSTWVDGCPVEPEDLSYLTMSFWGFDGRAHTGEMIVNRSVAQDVITAFAAIFEARFPIEEMTVVPKEALDADPTGDGNNTTAFVCRAVTGGSSFSQHAYGLAIDINPFHNPYIRGEVVLPELAASYLDRAQPLAGMVADDGPVVQAFDDIGWGWGGDWESLKDYQHFSVNNR